MSFITIRKTHFSDCFLLSLSPNLNLVCKTYLKNGRWRNEYGSSSWGLGLHMQAPSRVYISLNLRLLHLRGTLFFFPSIYLGSKVLMFFPSRVESSACGSGSHTLGWSLYGCPQVLRVQGNCICTESLFMDFSHGMFCWGSHNASAVSSFILLTTLK